MNVSRGQVVADLEGRGVRARTMRLMLETAIALMQDGQVPSVSEVAEAAGVSRATSYRCFQSQAALVGAVVDAALGPILDWRPRSDCAAERVAELLEVALPRIGAFEATFRAALRLSLDQRNRPGTVGIEPTLRRGHRVELLREAVAPLQPTIGRDGTERLAEALSLVFGIEAFIVLKDIWGLDQDGVEDAIGRVSRALVADAEAASRKGRTRG